LQVLDYNWQKENDSSIWMEIAGLGQKNPLVLILDSEEDVV
jgi:hypothetical protein